MFIISKPLIFTGKTHKKKSKIQVYKLFIFCVKLRPLLEGKNLNVE